MPEDHPQNIFMERTNGFMTADLFDEESATLRLYFWVSLKSFLVECLEKTELFDLRRFDFQCDCQCFSDKSTVLLAF